MKYYIIAGEASGDLHGSNLMKELKVSDPAAEFRFFGGDLMEAVGGTLVKHYREMAFMGFVNVIMNIRTIKRNMEFCKKDMLEFQPDVLILIDYPGFNLRIAEFAKEKNIKVFYYISPKIWAWKEHRAKKIKAFVDEMFTILPFETEFYEKHNFKVNYIGNPLLDSINDFQKKALSRDAFCSKNGLDERPIVALLAGSRYHEIKRMLPTMIKATDDFKDYQFVIAGIPVIDEQVYREIIGASNVKLIFNKTYDLLNNAHAAMVTSGTASLETALFNVPQTVLYKIEGGRLMNFIAWTFILKTKWVSLPNIILNKEIIKELIQVDMTVENVRNELNKFLKKGEERQKMLADYNELHKLIGEPGCSKRAAEKMVKLLERN